MMLPALGVRPTDRRRGGDADAVWRRSATRQRAGARPRVLVPVFNSNYLCLNVSNFKFQT
jgi:hypothetical protein